MKNNTKRILSAIMALVLLIGLLPGIILPAEAATVNYVYADNHIYNWGERGTTATFLSPNAEKFYEDNNTSYEELAALSGSTTTSSVPSSALYRELKDLMSSNHSYKTSYDATKNLYQYTDCQNGGGKISSFYSGKAIGPSWDGSWNREHTWPNSKGLGGADENDIMMLRPTSTSENSSRGNTAYGKSSGYYDPNSESGGKHNLHGDVARIMLYTYVRWGNTSYMWGKSGVIESREVLLEWMEEDPVDTWELGRNDAVEAITGTRNVFVDYPELAFVMFGADIPAEYTTPSGSAAASGYTITAVSNNTTWGTVSVSGRTINTSPAAGYAVSGYTVVSGTATVTRTGNSFIVNTSSDVTIKIEFAPRAESTVVFVQQDGAVGEERAYTGDSITLPAHQGAVAEGCTFVGWAENALEETVAVPTFYAAGSKYTVGGNTTLYALYSRFEGGTGNTSNVFEPYTGALTEGDYVIVGAANDGDFAMVAADTGKSRLQAAAVSYSNGDILSPAADIIWHIAPTGGYWTIYNAATGKYAGGNGTKNQAVLLSSADDAAKWTASGTSTYEFVNKGNDSKGVNPLLRRNGAVGFACYAKNTNVGAPLKLYKRLAGTMYYFTGAEKPAPDPVALEVQTLPYTTYYMPGDLLDTTGLTLTLTYSDNSTETITEGFTVSGFDAYMSGEQTITVTYAGFTATYVVVVIGEPNPVLATPVLSVSGNALVWEYDPAAEWYEVFRASSENGNYNKIASVEGEGRYVDTKAETGKTYYYKITAMGSVPENDSDYSNAVSITYKGEAPAAGVTTNESGKPVISWTAVSGAKKYEVYRATSLNGKYKKVTTTSKLTYTDTKAEVGKTYFYKIKATSKNAEYSEIVSATAICAAPIVKISVDTTTGKPSLSWSKVSGASKYRIYRCVDSEPEFILLSEQTGTSFKDTTAPVDVSCAYAVQVVGKKAGTDSAFSKPVNATACLAKPAVKGGIHAASGKPQLSWEEVEGAHSYIILRGTKKSNSLKYYAEIAEIDVISYIDESAVAGKTYYYKVIAVNAEGQSKETDYVKITGKCAAPAISVQVDDNSGKPTISWEKISGAKKYTVYRATSENGKYKKLATTSNGYYTDSKAEVGKTYFYKVIANASSSSYNSGYSNVVSTAAVCAAPKLTATVDAATGKPSLTWSKVTGAVAYKIYRQLPGEEDFTMIAEITGTSYIDKSVGIDTKCIYKVMAVGKTEELNSAFTAEQEVTATISRTPIHVYQDESSGLPYITWSPRNEAVEYELYRSTSEKSGYTLLVTTQKLNLWLDETAVPGKTYYYKVVSVSANGVRSPESKVGKITAVCSQPRPTVEINFASGKPVISWEKVDGASKGYEIYRSVNGGKFKKLATTKSITYTDSKAEVGNIYSYRVRSLGSKSSYNSSWSEDVVSAAVCAQPKLTIKIDSKGKPAISWKKVSGVNRYYLCYVDVTDVIDTENGVDEDYIVENMQYIELNSKKTSYTLNEAEAGRMYIITMMAVAKNEEFSSAPSDPVYVAASCAAPKIKATTSDGYNALTWNEVEGADFYIVYRSTKKSSGFEFLTGVEGGSYVDYSADKGKTYYYRVTAVVGVGESNFSNVVSIKTKK